MSRPEKSGIELYNLFTLIIPHRKTWATSVDPDQTPHNVASDPGLHCLPLIQRNI